MLGAIYGDICGSRYEWYPCKDVSQVELDRPDSHFTDDTVCALAIAEALMDGADFAEALRRFVNRHLDAGYGLDFFDWALNDEKGAYNSWGNGSAMRAPAIGWLASSVKEAADLAKASAEITHSHPDGIRGAQVVAVAVRMLLEGRSKDELRDVIENTYGYSLARTPDEIRPGYMFEVSCATSVPEAISCFLHTESFDEAIIAAISLGGDADTQACIAGALAEAHYGSLPEEKVAFVQSKLPEDLGQVLERFLELSSVIERTKTPVDALEVFVPPAKNAFILPADQQAMYEREMAKMDMLMSAVERDYRPGIFTRIARRLRRR